MSDRIPGNEYRVWGSFLIGFGAMALVIYFVGKATLLLIEELQTLFRPGTFLLVLTLMLALVALIFSLIPKPKLNRAYGLWWVLPFAGGFTAYTGLLLFSLLLELSRLVGLTKGHVAALIVIIFLGIVWAAFWHNRKQWPALVGAADMGNGDRIKKLIREGADLNARGPDGNTALMMAAGAGHLDVVEVLLNAGVDLNAQNDKGATALILAAEQGREEIIKTLLAANADATVKDSIGRTALNAAVDSGFNDGTSVIEMLKHYRPSKR